MSRVFMATEVEGVASWWRIHRKDGVTIGLTSHDRDLWFDGVLHRTTPGMVPSAIRRTADLGSDSAEVSGALAHDSISAVDLANGRFDGARVEVGVVDWETLERAPLYTGEIGDVTQEAGTFGAELISAKALLDVDLVPRTSPTCRAQFCGPSCNLAPVSFTHEAVVSAIDADASQITVPDGPTAQSLAGGFVRWIDGPQAGVIMQVVAADGGDIVTDMPLDANTPPGARILIREGCDHTLHTCATRFANAANFQGEPFLPGNDLITRYPTSSS
ncbi:MAG: hypothetical protein RLZZ08_62 [Pseudomonadota bacterium]|jgi:uncharacterized phage protein (TIGR02218 family)